jgi:hypothetical protein
MTYPVRLEEEYVDAHSETSHFRKRIHGLLGTSVEIVHQKRRIKCFVTTGSPGSHIRHAITGRSFVDRVGSAREYVYFSVLVATGFLKSRGDKFAGPLVLYYETPEEHEQHFGVTLDEATKRQFQERRKLFAHA